MSATEVQRIEVVMQAAYDAIYLELRSLIERGTYPYRSLLPSESVLVSQYGCAHNTVRKSLSMLAADGYVQPVHGKGVRVIFFPEANSPLQSQCFLSTEIESFREAMQRIGRSDTTTKVLAMQECVADGSPLLAPYEKGTPLVHLDRIRIYEGQVLSHESNYLRADIVEGMTKADAEYSIYHYIRSVRGEKLVTCKRYIAMEPATDRDRELLDLKNASHVVVIRSRAFDGDGLLCEFCETRQHPEVFTFYQTAIHSRARTQR